MAPKKDTSKSPAKGARKRSTSRARSKSPGRRGRPPKSETPAATPTSEPSSVVKGRGRSKSPGRKGKAEQAKASPSPARQPKKAAETTGKKKKTSLSPPAKKANSPQRKKRASTPPRKPPSPPTEKKLRGKKSVTPAITELKTEVASAIAKKVNDLLKKKGETKEKIITVTTTETTVTKKKEEKKVEKKGDINCEYGGSVGVFFFTLLLPALVIVVNVACTKKSCSVTTVPNLPTSVSSYYDVRAVLLFFGWFIAQAVLAALPIGRVKEGLPLVSGKRLKYRLNGFLSLILSAVAFGGLYYLQYPLGIVLDVFLQLSATAIEFSFLFGIFLYLRSRYHRGDSLVVGGNTGNKLHDFFVGRELNPRIRNFDLKLFIELHFASITWVWINATFVLKAYQETGTFPPALLLVTGSQLLYVADQLWHEENALSTISVASDGLGFWNVLGSTAWVPFLYTLQGRYLLDHPQTLPYWAVGAILLLYLIGHFIFRGSNWQKHTFLTNPHHKSVSALETIPATAGHRLLVGGWWGISRHPNYLGDLIIALAWSLPCGFNSPLPYFYPLTLLFLLIHRALRDERACHQKFGAAWDRYCQRVKYRIIPYIY